MYGSERDQTMYVSTRDPETVDDSPLRLFAPGQVGKFLTVKQPHSSPAGTEAGREKVYQYVLTDSAMSVAPYRGAVAWWADKAKKMVTTAATNRGDIAGVFQGPVTKGNYGFIQKGGPATTKLVDGPASPPTAVGIFVIPSATAAKADTLAAGTAASYPPLGVTTGVWDAAAAEAIVDLKLADHP